MRHGAIASGATAHGHPVAARDAMLHLDSTWEPLAPGNFVGPCDWQPGFALLKGPSLTFLFGNLNPRQKFTSFISIEWQQTSNMA
jgi:hypothetical protein